MPPYMLNKDEIRVKIIKIINDSKKSCIVHF